MNRTGGKVEEVQALRACACLCVVAYHALRLAGVDWPNGAAGVDLFFVISGYVMARSAPASAGAFLAARARRIVPLYWGLTAVKLAVAAWAPGLTPDTAPTAWNALASFLFIPSRNGLGEVRPVLPVGWTLQFEAMFYVLFAAALALGRRPGAIGPVLAGLAVAGAWRRPDWPAPLFLCNGLALEFLGGMALAERRGAAWMLPVGAAGLLLLPQPGALRGVVWGGAAWLTLAGALALQGRARVPLPCWRWGRRATRSIWCTRSFCQLHGISGSGRWRRRWRWARGC